ncbi:MAG: FAD-binding protein [Maritimibacter sp.]
MHWKHTDYAGWGRVKTASGDLARPERAKTLKALLDDSPAPAIGNRRSYGDAALNDEGRAIDMTRLDRVMSFDADTGVIEVEAGVTIGELVRLFAPKGWLPAVCPGTGFATIGGAIAMDVHGKNHHEVGSFGAHLVSITLLQGGKKVTITPKSRKSLWRATIGGLGQTGVILSAKMQMMATPGAGMHVVETRADHWEDFIEKLDTSTAPYVVGWIDATAKGHNLGRGILEEGSLSTKLPMKPKGTKSVPFDAPRAALSGPVVKLFNTAYFHRIPEAGRENIKPIADMLFPLDKIHDWNRLYGKGGFHQFQCVVPLEAVEALRDMLEKIARSRLASPLAVLKRMGAPDAHAPGMMSFPMEGYTLAVDFPAKDKATALIAKLEAMTLAAGGRIYLAKDALASGDTIKAMYPEWQAFAAEALKADPEGQFTTDMVRRLRLRSET